MDLGDLPTCRGSKKQKSGKTPPSKVPISSMTVHLDASVVNLVPQTTPSVQTIPLVQPEDLPSAAKAPHKAHPSEKSKHPPNLVLDEGYAWRMFKGIIIDNEVNSCYNISVKDFERSAIHDLFKVYGSHYFPFIF